MSTQICIELAKSHYSDYLNLEPEFDQTESDKFSSKFCEHLIATSFNKLIIIVIDILVIKILDEL